MSTVLALARPDILQLQPYQHASWDPSLERMHANEMPWRAQGDDSDAGLNRYPEPQPQALVERMARLYGVPSTSVLVGRGSDEAIDLLVRALLPRRRGQCRHLARRPLASTRWPRRSRAQTVRRGAAGCARGFALDADAVLAAWPPTRRSSSCARRTTRPATCSTRPSMLRVCRELAEHVAGVRRRGVHRIRRAAESSSGGLARVSEPGRAAHLVEGVCARRRAPRHADRGDEIVGLLASASSRPMRFPRPPSRTVLAADRGAAARRFRASASAP